MPGMETLAGASVVRHYVWNHFHHVAPQIRRSKPLLPVLKVPDFRPRLVFTARLTRAQPRSKKRRI